MLKLTQINKIRKLVAETKTWNKPSSQNQNPEENDDNNNWTGEGSNGTDLYPLREHKLMKMVKAACVKLDDELKLLGALLGLLGLLELLRLSYRPLT